MVLGEFHKKTKKYEIKTSETEPHSPWQNNAKREIKIVKKIARYYMQSNLTPIVLWTDAYKYASYICLLTSSSKVEMNSRTLFECTHGYTPEISEYASFSWYQWVYYWEPTITQNQQLGCWCGVAESTGGGHLYHILNSNGFIVVQSTVSHLSDDDMHKTLELRKEFDAIIKERIGGYNISAVKNSSIKADNPYKDFTVNNNDNDNEENETIEFASLSNEAQILVIWIWIMKAIMTQSQRNSKIIL